LGADGVGEVGGCCESLALKGHTGAVWSVAFSRDRKRIVSGSDDKALKVWDATGGQEMPTAEAATDPH